MKATCFEALFSLYQKCKWQGETQMLKSLNEEKQYLRCK